MELRRESKSESQSDHETVVPTPASDNSPKSEPGSKDLTRPGIRIDHDEAPGRLQSPTPRPDAMPQERLELRRLEMNALYVLSASSGDEQEPASGFQTVSESESESERASRVSVDSVGADRTVQVRLPSPGPEAADNRRSPSPVPDVGRMELLLRPKGWGPAEGGRRQFISVVDIGEEDLASPIPEPHPTLPAVLESDLKPEPTIRSVDSDQRKPVYDQIPDSPETTFPALSRARDDIDTLTGRDVMGTAPPQLGIPEGGRTAVPAVDQVTEQLLNGVPFQGPPATGLVSTSV